MKRNISTILHWTKMVAVFMLGICLMTGFQVWAANQSQFSQSIAAGALSVDMVDAGGTTVANPAVSFSALNFSFATQDSTGTLGTSSERIRAYNPTGTATWTVNLAGSAATAVWTDGGSNTYDFNDGNGYTDGGDADSVGGQLTVNPSGSTVAGVSGCATTNVTAGTSDSFVQGSVDSIDLMSASAGAATYCRWDQTGIALTQRVPASQVAASYAITMVLSIL